MSDTIGIKIIDVAASPSPWQRVPWRSIAIVVPFLAVFIALSIGSPAFLGPQNIGNVLDRQAGILIVAAASTLVIIAGGIDLSIGATYMFTAVICGTVIIKVGGEAGAGFGIAAGVLAGLLVGLANGVIITYLKINPLIATLAMSFIILGATKLVSQFGKQGVGQIRVDFPEFRWLATTKPLGVSLPTWIAFVIIVILAIVLWRTTFGRYVYAAGGNAEAARLAGIRVNLVRISTFALTGLAAGVAGVLDLARTPSVPENDAIATTLTFTVLAGIVVGGTSILGGEGAVWRTVLGILFIAMLYNGFTLLRIDPLFQGIALGTIILVAVGFDAWSKFRRR
ncbi:ABC transporter permease [Pseudolysinimonas sp.]|jgi:ribose transport system permease protein|uniref:ABC transporter permease n=1 Tax=Pseudolysinimonas sp. TaxID=2680009 RepID=UPI0037847AEB